MPRIPQDELDRIKREVSLLRLIESQGHELKKRGRDWVMRCVFHEEDTPSLSVSEAKNVYHCFGCGASGTVLDWVMKTHGISLPHAVQLLRNDAPLDGTARVGVNRSSVRHLPSLAADVDEAALLREVADAYHATLKQSPEALAYLEQRGLVHGELVDAFRLGYANKSLTYRLPPGYSKEGKEVRAKLQRVGENPRRSKKSADGGCVRAKWFASAGGVRKKRGSTTAGASGVSDRGMRLVMRYSTAAIKTTTARHKVPSLTTRSASNCQNEDGRSKTFKMRSTTVLRAQLSTSVLHRKHRTAYLETTRLRCMGRRTVTLS